MSISFRIFVYPWLWLLSLLPFWLMYLFSNFLSFVLYRIVGYRKQIVRDNLLRSFPEKSEMERLRIEKRFYRHLTDLMLETIKEMTISRRELMRRLVLKDTEGVFAKMNEEKQSCIVVMSHCGNWEWVCISAQLTVDQHTQCVYKTLHNKNWDRWFHRIRSRFGTVPFPMEKTLRVMADQKDIVTATAFIGDQNPSSGKNAYWTTFLNQETCFMQGSEKVARKLNQPVVYMQVLKVRRGYYECYAEVLEKNSSASEDGAITEKIARATERDILAQPENWLWSHRRWKHRREEK